jgi:hypothetical protein
MRRTIAVQHAGLRNHEHAIVPTRFQRILPPPDQAAHTVLVHPSLMADRPKDTLHQSKQDLGGTRLMLAVSMF